DFFEVEDELGNKTLCSKCDTQVFNYLVNKGVIVNNNSDKDGVYKMFCPPMFGEDISPVDIDINATESDRIGYTQLEIYVSTKSKEELIK
ncbi:hypothetical protein KJ570_01425, partial [Patescibacteria group bacterium]|nr:hypothetical protein [Patescibacteria group bacterium]